MEKKNNGISSVTALATFIESKKSVPTSSTTNTLASSVDIKVGSYSATNLASSVVIKKLDPISSATNLAPFLDVNNTDPTLLLIWILLLMIKMILL